MCLFKRKSLKEQYNENWELIVIDDMTTDDSVEMLKICRGNDERINFIKNKEKKWALKNVVEASRKYQDEDDTIIAILDADDSLCNENAVEKILKMYCDETDAVWTAHSWDINGLNISRELPGNINPYQYPWVSSHLKTFRASLLKDICDENFKDLDGKWFKRGYDQALYLPILFKSRKRKYLNEICYLYRINSNSMKNRDWKEKSQLDTVRLVRSRGYVENV